MRLRRFFQLALLTAALTFSGAALADDPQDLIKSEHEQVTSLLRQPSTADRNAKINAVLAGLVDYDTLTARTFGAHWTNGDLNDSQKAECRDLLKKIVEKTWRRNLIKTLNYDIQWKGAQPGDNDGEQEVKTEAQSKDNTHDPPTRVDYTMIDNGSGWHVVDIVTEGSRLTVNYGRQVNSMLTDHDYNYLVTKLREKANG